MSQQCTEKQESLKCTFLSSTTRLVRAGQKTSILFFFSHKPNYAETDYYFNLALKQAGELLSCRLAADKHIGL